MRFFITSILCLLYTIVATAQIHKIYIDKNGNFTNRAEKADAYVIVRKLSDSDYAVQKYDLRDTILLRGEFKDSLLTIPNGKFLYYEKKKIATQLIGVMHTDTNNFIAEVGFFLNGVKTGIWTEFEKRGMKKCSYTYKDDKLNGRYQKFSKYHNDYVIEDGNYVDGLRDGAWNHYGYDTLQTPVITRTFSKDKQTGEIIHLEAAHDDEDVRKYFLAKMKKLDTLLKEVRIRAIIGVNGEVKSPVLISALPPQVRDVTMDALKNMPHVIPQTRDGKPEEMTYTLRFSIVSVNHRPTQIYSLSLTKDVGNGMFFDSGITSKQFKAIREDIE